MTLPARDHGGIELLARLEEAGAITRTSLVLPPNLPWEQYEALASMLGQLHRTSAWLIGDLLNYGEKIYGETYTQAASLTGLADQTLMNYASVCKYVPRQRRRATLPFSVHAEVAYREPDEQEHWLGLAEQHHWKRVELRRAMRGEPVQEPGREILPPAVVGLPTYCPHCGGSLNGYIGEDHGAQQRQDRAFRREERRWHVDDSRGREAVIEEAPSQRGASSTSSVDGNPRPS